MTVARKIGPAVCPACGRLRRPTPASKANPFPTAPVPTIAIYGAFCPGHQTPIRPHGWATVAGAVDDPAVRQEVERDVMAVCAAIEASGRLPRHLPVYEYYKVALPGGGECLVIGGGVRNPPRIAYFKNGLFETADMATYPRLVFTANWPRRAEMTQEKWDSALERAKEYEFAWGRRHYPHLFPSDLFPNNQEKPDDENP